MGSSETSLVDLPTDEIISLVCDGRTDLYEEIIRRFQGDVLRVVSAMLYDRGATEDLVQQVFVNAYLHLPDFQSGRDFGGWIRTIARNAVREELRRASRYDRRLKVYGELLAARLDDDDVEQRDRQLQAALGRCLEQLPERAEKVVRLRYYEGLACEEVSSRLNSSAGAIRNLLSRVRVQLRECIERGMAKE